MTYSPKPNTVAWRAIRHLESLDIGAEVTTGALGDALNVPASSLQACLQPAVDAGLLYRRQKPNSVPRSPMFWSLTDHSAGEKAPPLSARSVFDLGAAAKPELPAPETTETPPALEPQQVLKAEAARPDATDRDAPVTTSPVGGPTGAGQPAAAGPADDLKSNNPPIGPLTAMQARVQSEATEACSGAGAVTPERTGPAFSEPPPPIRIALWSDGCLQIEQPDRWILNLSADDTRQLVDFLDRVLTDRGGA